MKIGLLSDLHIGNPISKWSDATSIINEIAPNLDMIILMGDVTEEMNPYPSTLEEYNNNMAGLKNSIQQIMGEFTNSISKHLDKTVFLRGNHDDQIINNMKIVENHAILRTKLGRIVVFHGHQTNLSKYGQKFGWGLSAGRELKVNLDHEHYIGVELTSSDFIIMGHCHVAYFDSELKVCSLGSWLGDYKKNRNVGWYAIINDEDVDSPKKMIQMRRIDTEYVRSCQCGYNNLKNNDLYCPKCKRPTAPLCSRFGCNRPVRGEDDILCKKHLHDDFKFYE